MPISKNSLNRSDFFLNRCGSIQHNNAPGDCLYHVSVNENLVLFQIACFDIHRQVTTIPGFPRFVDKFFQAFAEISRLEETMHSQSHTSPDMDQSIGSAIDPNVA